MQSEQQRAILVIGLQAAFSDGAKDDRERNELRRIAESLGEESSMPDLSRIYQDVLLKRVSIEAAAAELTEPGHRQLAYEMAVCVCDADGRQSDPERHFLAELRKLLKLDPDQAAAFESEADAIVSLTDAAAPAAATGGLAVAPGPAMAVKSKEPDAELDKSILNYALVNGALELLPQSWASMAIIPLQIKMVFGIGKAHGVDLDQGHIKEFIGAAGVGLTSQYLEQFGRKLLGGLLGKAAGKTSGKLGGAATGMAFSFATTYALGQLSKRYYAGGRVMNTTMLRETFQNLLGPAKQMQTQYLPQIRQQADTLDMGRVPAATDIAFALGVLSLLGSRVPAGLKVFLLTVAILDDLGAIVIIALFYSDNLAPASFGVAGAALLMLLALNRPGVVRVAPYLFVGMIMWVAVLKSGVHATLAGVALAFFIPLRTGGTEPQSPLRRLEQNLHPLVAFAILPLFAFANSGVSLQGVTVAALLEPVPLGIAAGLLVGKTIGVFLACWVTVQLGFARLPGGANWMSTLGVSVLCGIGFTMSLFIAGLAFNEAGSEYIVQTRLGILGGSLAAALLGYALLRASLPARSSDTAGSKAGRTPSRAD